MEDQLKLKYDKLKSILSDLQEVVVAYSGGVDSTLLLKVAHDTLGEKVIAIIGKSLSMPDKEFNEGLQIANQIGVNPIVIETNELALPVYIRNPVDRCYHCKKHIFGEFITYIKQHGCRNLIDGSNYDDLKDYRPGKQALEEFKVISPLRDAEFNKTDIRQLSKALQLTTWNKEAMACLSTRIAYNEEITKEKLIRIAKAEEYLRAEGFDLVRARLQEGHVRIETHPEQVKEFYTDKKRNRVFNHLKELGFNTVSVDLEGYRMGSMNDGFLADN